MARSGQQFIIAAGDHEASVVEVGAGLRRYTHQGVDITAAYGEDDLPPKGCGAVLVPWPNRLRGGHYVFDGEAFQLGLTEPLKGNAIHGLGRWARWVPVRHEQSAVTLRLDIVAQVGWPFEVAVEVTYAVRPDTGLSVSTTALNHGARRAPFGAGFHPYLSTRGVALDDVRLKVPARERLILDEANCPVGSQAVAGSPYDLRRGPKLRDLRLDDAFTDLSHAHGRPVVDLRIKKAGARLWFDETFGFVQVFTVDQLTDGQPAIAVEPMTCAPDAFNTGAGLVLLEPGAVWSGAWGIQPY